MSENLRHYRIIKGEDKLKEALKLIAYLHNSIKEFPKFVKMQGVDLEVIEMALEGLLINNRLELEKLRKKDKGVR